MSQALYDYQNGMSPEELWARYRQYPWIDNAGNTVMQGESNRTLGPEMPSGVMEKVLPLNLGGGTIFRQRKDKSAGTMINSLFTNSDKLMALNHELQHSNEAENNLPVGPFINNNKELTRQDYDSHPGEMQARMAGHRSVMPIGLLDMIHPYTQMYPDNSTSDLNYDTNYLRNLAEKKFANSKDKEKKLSDYNKLLELYDSRNNENAAYRMGIMEDKVPHMKNSANQARKIVSKSLIDELLQRGRNFYYPPMVSQ
jgi:hypothetical protein